MNKKEIAEHMMSVDYAPVLLSEEEISNKSIMKFPIVEMASLGAMMSPITTAIETIATSGAGQQLYALNPRGYAGQLAAFKDGSGYLSTVMNNGNIIGQAAFVPVDPTMINTVTMSNPAMIFIAAALMSVDKKLDDIKETQEEMFSFMNEKEKAKNKANLNALEEIMKEYKFNRDNQLYISSSQNLVKAIRKSSDEIIELRRAEIKKKLEKKKIIHTDLEVATKINKLRDELKEYQIALYTYAFSSFTEIMLIENFKEEYIKSVIEKIESYSNRYLKLYTDCYSMVEEYSRKSVGSGMRKGAAVMGKAAGNLIAKVPVVNKGLLDEGLIAAGNALENWDSKKELSMMSKIISRKNSCVAPFIEKLKAENQMLWVHMMNEIHQMTEEIILEELIYN